MIDSAVTDLPEPDSPTSASVSPLPMSNETLVDRQRRRGRRGRTRPTDRGRESRGSDASMRAHLNVLRGSKASRTASPMKIKQRQHDRDGEEAGEAEPRRLHVGLALRQQFAERGRARRQAEAEEVERGQRHHRATT